MPENIEDSNLSLITNITEINKNKNRNIWKRNGIKNVETNHEDRKIDVDRSVRKMWGRKITSKRLFADSACFFASFQETRRPDYTGRNKRRLIVGSCIVNARNKLAAQQLHRDRRVRPGNYRVWRSRRTFHRFISSPSRWGLCVSAILVACCLHA